MTENQDELIKKIVGELVPRNSTAAVLFHHVVAERLGVGPTDLKCLHILRERGPMAGSELASVTGLTSGAVSGVVGRLERAGFLRREADPHDGRKQVLHAALERGPDIQRVFRPIRDEAAEMLERFDADQLSAIADFLAGITRLINRHGSLLRAEAPWEEEASEAFTGPGSRSERPPHEHPGGHAPTAARTRSYSARPRG
jgi:DNA-binding MarR family transcriptional regulator